MFSGNSGGALSPGNGGSLVRGLEHNLLVDLLDDLGSDLGDVGFLGFNLLQNLSDLLCLAFCNLLGQFLGKWDILLVQSLGKLLGSSASQRLLGGNLGDVLDGLSDSWGGFEFLRGNWGILVGLGNLLSVALAQSLGELLRHVLILFSESLGELSCLLAF